MEPPETLSQTKHKNKSSSSIGPTCPPTDLNDKNPKNDDDKNNNDNDDLGSITSHADEGNDDVSINLATFNKTTDFQSSQEQQMGDSTPQGADDTSMGLGTSFSQAQPVRPQLEQVISF
jgi:hypothetical protein